MTCATNRSLDWLMVLFSLVGLSACIDRPLPTGTRDPSTQPAKVISDAAHGGVVQHFYFLPPLVSQPTYSGTFDPSAAPEVQVCAMSGSDCVALVADFFTTTGPGSETVRLDQLNELYMVNWHTDQFDIDPNRIYRIRVVVGRVVAGFADVQVAATAGQAKV